MPSAFIASPRFIIPATPFPLALRIE